VTPAEGARAVVAATHVADRLDALADTAELMGDEAGACRFRQQAAHVRLEAMDLLDHDPLRSAMSSRRSMRLVGHD
jgi:hypothetical protein